MRITAAVPERRTIGTAHIVFFVVAAAAPLTSILGASPAAFAFGNGPGVPLVYLLIGGLYLVFSIGFTAMSPHVAGQLVSMPMSPQA